MLDHLSKLEMDHREKSSHALEFATMSKVHRERAALALLPSVAFPATPCRAKRCRPIVQTEQSRRSIVWAHRI